MSEPNIDTFDKQEWANRMVIYCKHAEIRTVDQLLQACQVDMGIWEIYGKPYLNKWSVGARAKSSTLQFDEGKMSGSMDEHGLIVAPLFQVKLRLVRKHPVIVHPTIQPIECPTQFVRQPSPRDPLCNAARTMLFADNQIGYSRDRTGHLIPFHDRRCLDIALQIAQVTQVDHIVIAGDLLDLAEWSDKFLKSPGFYQTTQPSLEEAFWWLRQFRIVAPTAKITVKFGNHEQRMRHALAKHLPQAYDLVAAANDGVEISIPPALSLPNLLQLERLDISFDMSPSNQVQWESENFGFYHGDIIRHQPGATARAVVEKYRRNVVFFHTHRAESISMAVEHGMATAINPGCMCHTDGRVPGSKRDNTWSNGLLIADHDKSGIVAFQTVPIVNGLAVFDGLLLSSRDDDIMTSLKRDLPRWSW